MNACEVVIYYVNLNLLLLDLENEKNLREILFTLDHPDLSIDERRFDESISLYDRD